MMLQTIKPIWFWAGMKNCLSQLVNNCVECQKWARSRNMQPPREIPEEISLKGPMDRGGVDIMSWAGKQYLVMVDYYSYYKWCHELKKVDTQTVVQVLTDWFNQGHGLPRILRVDSGPQFRVPFNNFLEKLGILRETSSAYTASSNGMAERAAGSLKRVIKKGMKGSLLQLTADLNNLVRSDNSVTPTELIAGHAV